MSASIPSLRPTPLRVRVVIPALDAAQTIEHALEALRTQVDLQGAPLPPEQFAVMVLAATGADETHRTARAYARRYPAFPLQILDVTSAAGPITVGTARRLLSEQACAGFEAEGQDGIVASTDADTIVAPDWIAATLSEFDQGVDAVGGRIVLSKEGLAQLPPELQRAHLQDMEYQLMLAELGARIDPSPYDPSPLHHQHFGASLAMRADIYRRASVIFDRLDREDTTFYDALQQIDAQVRHSPLVRVTRSALRRTREPSGESSRFEGLGFSDRESGLVLVESVPRSLKRLQLRRELRNRWRYRRAHRELERGTRMDAFAFFGAFLADIRTEIERYLDETAGNESVPLEHAIGDLRAVLATHR